MMARARAAAARIGAERLPAIAPAERAVQIARQLPLRRRRLGLALVGLGVLAIAAQSLLEWLLPYDVLALEDARRLFGLPQLEPAALVWGWAGVCLAGLVRLALAAAARTAGGVARTCALGSVTGLALGSAYLAAGGAAAALAILLLAGLASLGWQTLQHGGRALLLGAALGVSGWDMLLSAYPTLWAAALVVAAMFVWIDRLHILANDRRLFAALEQRDGLIRDLDSRTDELQRLQGTRTRLLASISHDLRQPLQAVRLYADALAGRLEQDTDAQRLLARQMQAADDATAMLDQFSEFSAIEQGMLVSRPELVNLRELLERIASSLQATHAPERLRLGVHGRRDACWVWTDRSQLARVVQNLAGNAVRYSLDARPGRAARVVLAVRPAGGGLAIDVLDNGRGIPADQLDRVFEPYVQLPVEGGAPGAPGAGRGLGLAIVRGLATQLGLSIAPVRSRPGQGSRFRILLPAQLHRPSPRVADPSGEAGPAALRLDGWLIALLDDEDLPRAALRAALEGLGATVVEAGSLARLVPRLDAESRFPDALVFDLDLGPDEPDGRAAIAELRESWELDVPAVLVTGRVGSRSVILPPRCSLHDKPVALADLAATLHRLVPQGAPRPI